MVRALRMGVTRQQKGLADGYSIRVTDTNTHTWEVTLLVHQASLPVTIGILLWVKLVHQTRLLVGSAASV